MNSTLKVGVSSISKNISPFNIYSCDYEICRALFPPLFKMSKEGHLLPNIIEQWEINDCDNEYLLVLRKDIFFHNGRKALAQDIEFSLCRGMMKGARSTFSELLSDIEGYEEVSKTNRYVPNMCSGIKVFDDYRLKIKLKHLNLLFLKYFTRSALSIVPREEFLENDLWVWKDNPIGVGAYCYESLSEDSKVLTLKKNEDYFEERIDSFDKLQFVVYTDVSQVDLLTEVENQTENEFEILKSPISVTIAIEYFVLHDKDKMWKELRSLINLALNKEDILSSIPQTERSIYSPTHSFLPVTILDVPNYEEELINLNFQVAKENYLLRWGYIPQLSIIVYNNYSEHSHLRKMQNKLYNLLSAKGFDVVKTELSSLSESLLDTQQHILVSSSSFNYNDPEDLSLFFSSDKEIYRANTGTLINIRGLLKDAKKEININKRNKMYRKVEELVIENSLVFPIALTYESYLFRKSKIDGKSFFHQFYQPAYEYIKTLTLETR
ncbi:ABC transporter substrate-binding protein [Bacillus amyloliquefaciens]|uniref:ABC transporter substrate-binding protein n=1 Tax=Bacillus amyloliquefaciens TaxID=1390 RepID=UPI000824D4FF|nr:ABC transporter substrate-binding protein [Bacillus amyloliquefaciens]AOC90116.1 hypothetical protein BARD7_00625 [Bacillus amyloliquefaciens]RDY85631.1 ABC transporter substrate-binding protein [Bacillus amyloliquefaciens]